MGRASRACKKVAKASSKYIEVKAQGLARQVDDKRRKCQEKEDIATGRKVNCYFCRQMIRGTPSAKEAHYVTEGCRRYRMEMVKAMAMRMPNQNERPYKITKVP